MRAIWMIITICCLPGLVQATGQTPEIVAYDGQTNQMYATPLESYFPGGTNRPAVFSGFPGTNTMTVSGNTITISGTGHPNSTGCHRGYIGTWKIEGGYLFLVSLQYEDVRDNPGQADEFTIPLKEINPQWSPPVKAVWFSGKIRIGRGKRMGGEGLGTVREKDIFLEIKDGKLVSTEIFDVALDSKKGILVSTKHLDTEQRKDAAEPTSPRD